MTELKDIKAFAFDVDGIFTDGSVLALPNGDLLRTFNAKDSFSIRTAVINGFPVAIITGGCSESIISRFNSLSIPSADIYQMSKNKLPDLEHFCARHGLELKDVLFAGDDVPDVEALKAAGVGICPRDACIECREAADIVSERRGGKWFVRDIVEKTLRAQGKWIFNPEQPWGFSYKDEVNAAQFKTGRYV
ncbi:MAG: HAD hydrolase family protein [Bacteroidales bacterium]|nr:HAD hydrolase family protein [Bacteroidales bacterium]